MYTGGNGSQGNSFGFSRLIAVLMIVGVIVMGLFSAGKIVFPSQTQTQTANTSATTNVQQVCLQATGLGHRSGEIYVKTVADGAYRFVSDNGHYNWVVASTIELHEDEMLKPDVDVYSADGTRFVLKTSEQAVYVNGTKVPIKCR